MIKVSAVLVDSLRTPLTGLDREPVSTAGALPQVTAYGTGAGERSRTADLPFTRPR